MSVPLLPGAREPHVAVPRLAGTMGGSAAGTAGVPGGANTLAAATVLERKREGGGRPRHASSPEMAKGKSW
jgi:hypothetical protein